MDSTTRIKLGFALLALTGGVAIAQPPPLPPPPVPPGNPITEPKRVLGKILFWEEQLSSDNSMSCGTCHIPGSGGGTDPRQGTHPGFDGLFNTADDVFGSPGVPRTASDGTPINDPIFGFEEQVTGRRSPKNIMAAYGPTLFWDGRAGPVFNDPETGVQVLPGGGALEAQAVQPILASNEMASDGRTWNDVRNKLQAVTPLAFASRIPPDMAAAIAANPNYPALFQAAFGDPAINGRRIGLALATYQRTLIPNQSPWDRFRDGVTTALTPQQQQGLQTFQGGGRCVVCHAPPVFSNNTFRNIGVRPSFEDIGRQAVTNNPADRGRFRVPSVRNVGIKETFMHNGRLSSLTEVVNFYRNVNGVQFRDNIDPAIPAILIPPQAVAPLVDFLANGLTDPRVANEQFPFDRPKLLTEILPGDANCDGIVSVGDIGPFVLALTNPAGYTASVPCSLFTADVDGNGVVSVGDIAPLVALLTGG
ncbi:MAG: cytochrome c peroxidase [Phycisphaerae bacterium]|nr:cytochrome c peroxidase [Phycisphaerae bacterium]